MGRLIQVCRDDLTIRRVRKGRGFMFCDAEGAAADPECKARAKALAIPPAWTEVRIAADANAHIQALGVDAAGREQYIYHPDWENRRNRRKHQQLAMLTAALPRIRRQVARDLEAEAGDPKLALAIAIALIDRTAMRVGREKYLKTSGTRGASTLFGRDVKIEAGGVRMRFPAKSGKVAEYEIADQKLADAIGRIKALSGRRLLLYRTPTGLVRPINGGMLNAYLQDIAGTAITAKDFRTLHASALAADALARLAPGGSPTARKRQMAAVTRQVADFLRNTPAISRKSYIAPKLFDLFEKGRLHRIWQAAEAGGGGGLRQRERRLGAVLSLIP